MNVEHFAIATSGAILMGYLVVGAIFRRWATKTREPLFSRFAVAFYILALERCLLLAVGENQTHHALIYLTRMVAFLTIIAAIWNQSRTRPGS